MVEHKHKGVLTSSGGLRPHPVTRQHGSARVQHWHDEEAKGKGKAKKPAAKAVRPRKANLIATLVSCPVDDDGYICVDLIAAQQKGLRVKFARTEGRKKRIVGLQIDKDR